MTDQRPPQSIYREEALSAARDDWLGQPHLSSPVRSAFWSALAVVVSLVIILVMGLGTYTRNIGLTGQMVNSTGLVTLYAPASGRVTRVVAADGEAVVSGQILFSVTADVMTDEGPSAERIILETGRELEAIKTAKALRLADHARAVLHLDARISAKENEQARLVRLIETTRQQVGWLADTADRQRALVEKGLGLRLTQIDHQKDYYLAVVSLAAAERELARAEGDVLALRQQAADLPALLNADLNAFDRDEARVRQRLIEVEERAAMVVAAPVDGTLAIMMRHAGQKVTPEDPLATILPVGGRLEVELITTSHAVGLLSEGAEVLLRFDAFPFEQYGQYVGHLLSISDVPMPARPDQVPGPDVSQRYRIRVALPEAGVRHGGHLLDLRPGMTVTAHVRIETRRLYEWIFLPFARRVAAVELGGVAE